MRSADRRRGLAPLRRAVAAIALVVAVLAAGVTHDGKRRAPTPRSGLMQAQLPRRRRSSCRLQPGSVRTGRPAAPPFRRNAREQRRSHNEHAACDPAQRVQHVEAQLQRHRPLRRGPRVDVHAGPSGGRPGARRLQHAQGSRGSRALRCRTSTPSATRCPQFSAPTEPFYAVIEALEGNCSAVNNVADCVSADYVLVEPPCGSASPSVADASGLGPGRATSVHSHQRGAAQVGVAETLPSEGVRSGGWADRQCRHALGPCSGPQGRRRELHRKHRFQARLGVCRAARGRGAVHVRVREPTRNRDRPQDR